MNRYNKDYELTALAGYNKNEKEVTLTSADSDIIKEVHERLKDSTVTKNRIGSTVSAKGNAYLIQEAVSASHSALHKKGIKSTNKISFSGPNIWVAILTAICAVGIILYLNGFIVLK